MARHFRLVPEGVEVRFTPGEARLLSDLPQVLAGLGDEAEDPGAARLNPPVYLGDPEADAEWRRLAGSELNSARRADRSAFEMVVDAVLEQVGDDRDLAEEEPESVVISEEEAGAFLRVVNEVRLVLGARWGIDGPDDFEHLRPEAGEVLSYLGWLVTEIAEVLGAALDR